MRIWTALAASLAVGSLVAVGCVGNDAGPSGAGPDAGPGDAAAAGEAAIRCESGTAPRCEGNSIVACVDGSTSVTACPLGCDPAIVACKRMKATTAASTVSTSAATFATPIVDVVDLLFDTDTGYIGRRRDDGTPFDVIRAAGAEGDPSGITYALVDQAAGPKLAVFGFVRLDLRPGTKARVVGKNAVAFVSASDIVVEGQLSLRGRCEAVAPEFAPIPAGGGYGLDGPTTETDATPGSGSLSTPSAIGTNATQACGGGGGGGNGTDGDNGGAAANEDRTSAGGAGGKKRKVSIFDLPVVTGGGGGGAGYRAPGGGGATFIANGTIRIAGIVEAGGCGGRYASINGGSPSSCGSGGAGGGAGGTLFFETPRLVVAATGRILANGGAGGGGGSGSSAGRATDGAAASAIDATPAAGGMPGDINLAFGCKPGGSGSPFAELAGPCGGYKQNSTRAGGGGGGAGIIAARTGEGGVLIEEGAIVSPVLARDRAQTL